jgi:hypothetical protein
MSFVRLSREAVTVGATSPCDRPLESIRAWVLEYLCRPNPELGRPGPVCPFAAPAYQDGTIWVRIAANQVNSRQRTLDLMNEALEFFISMSNNDAVADANHAVLVVFPGLDNPRGYAIIDSCQTTLKPRFVQMGLMVGQFYRTCQEPGLRNPEFQPLKSPIPLLAIRYMVKSDIAFLKKSAEFLAAYNARFAMQAPEYAK